MTVTALSATDRAASTASRQTLAGDFNTFLKLLTTQLRQQDPLQPMDASAFTSQLVQFATVEQAIQTNSRLTDLTDVVRSSRTASALGLLGQEVTAATDSVGLAAEGDAQLSYRLPGDAASVQVTIRDARGRIVFAGPGAGTGQGEHVLTWDGRGNDGARLPAGTYAVSVEATAADGSALAVDRFVQGRVTGIEPDGAGVRLRVGSAAVPLEAVRAIRPAA